MVTTEKPEKYLNLIGEKVRSKEGSVGIPDTYLGTSICKRKIDGEFYWAFSANKYLKEAIKIIDSRMKKDGFWFAYI